MGGEGKVMCVTGATGFIASWLVKLLLRRGYTVKATVRDPDDPRRTGHLRSLEGAAERLHLYRADLLEEGSFEAAIDGCDGVFHTASPVLLDEVNDPQAWYILSKTLAEEAAWKFAKEHSLDLVTINPGVVIGPLLQPTLNVSNEAILDVINGNFPYPKVAFGWVGIKNVCEAHILAYEIPSASGRYCLVERVTRRSDIIKLIKEIYPSIQVSPNAEDDDPDQPMAQVSQEKTKGLGINFTPFEESLKETLDSLKEKGFVNF